MISASISVMYIFSTKGRDSSYNLAPPEMYTFRAPAISNASCKEAFFVLPLINFVDKETIIC